MPREKRLVRRAKDKKPIRQVAAVPVRAAADGVEVMLVTSNATRRFIVPKGWPMKGKSARQAAREEVLEEAGVTGAVLRKALGEYSYWKRLSERFVKVDVKVYLLEVEEVLGDAWREAGKRQRAWLTPADAAALIDEPELASLVSSISRDTLEAARQPAPENP